MSCVKMIRESRTFTYGLVSEIDTSVTKLSILLSSLLKAHLLAHFLKAQKTPPKIVSFLVTLNSGIAN